MTQLVQRQLALSPVTARQLQRQLEHLEYLSGLQRAATEEGAENHAYASNKAAELTSWNAMALRMADQMGCLSEDFIAFIRANNQHGLELISRLTLEGDIKLVEQLARTPVEPQLHLLDEIAYVVRQLKSLE